jgi:asparagine synthase (glutamine-hydrolysing)
MGRLASQFGFEEFAERGLASPANEKCLDSYLHILSLRPGLLIHGLFSPGRAGEALDPLGKLQHLELRSTLPDELLLYGDKLSMVHGLELRVPYLDHELVELVMGMPPNFKVRGATRKWIHREVCRRLLPHCVLRRGKLGFETPAKRWLKESSGNLVTDLMDPACAVYKYLSWPAVTKLVREYQRGYGHEFKLLFSVVVLERLARHYAESYS